MSDADIQKAVDEAKQFEEADRTRKEIIDTKNEADAIIFQTEKLLKDNTEIISEEDKTAVEEALTKLKTASESADINNMTAEDAENLKTEIAALTEIMHTIAAKIYQAQAEQAQQQDPNEPTMNEDGSFEGEYEPSLRLDPICTWLMDKRMKHTTPSLRAWPAISSRRLMGLRVKPHMH